MTTDEDVSAIVAGLTWRCFHCDEVFTNRMSAALHFGSTEDSKPACQIRAAESGLLWALRDAEQEALRASDALHAESSDALRAWRAAESRHALAVRSAEEAGYERGLRGQAATVANLRRALVWHGDPARLATTVEAWQRDVDEAVRFVRDNPDPDRPARPSLAEGLIAQTEGGK